MATMTSLKCPSLPCVDTVGTTPRTQNHEQKQNQRTERKQQRSNFAVPCAFGHLGDLAAAKSAASRNSAALVVTTSSTGRVPRCRGLRSAIALPMVLVLWVTLSASLKSSLLLQPAAAASFMNAVPPVTLLALALSQRAGASSPPAFPPAREPSPTEKASAAVRNRWSMWRQRVSAEEQGAGNVSTSGGPENPTGGEPLAAGTGAQLGDASRSPTHIPSETLLFPVPGGGGALLMTAGTGDGAMNNTSLNPLGPGSRRRQGATIEILAGTPDANPTSGSISSLTTSVPTPIGVPAFAAPRSPSNNGLPALRVTPGGTASSPVSRRTAPFFLAPSTAQLSSSPSPVVGSVLGPAVAGGSPVLHSLSPQLHVGREDGTPEAPVVIVARQPSAWPARETEKLLPNVEITQATASKMRGRGTGTPGFVYSSGGPVTGESELPFYRVTPPVHKDDEDLTRQHPLAKLQEALRQEQQQQQQEAANAENRGRPSQDDKDRPFTPLVLVQRKQSQPQQHAVQLQMNLPWGAKDSLAPGIHSIHSQQDVSMQHEPALLIPSVDHVYPSLNQDDETLSDYESSSEVWPDRYRSQQKPQVYIAASAGAPFDVAGDWQRRQMQQQSEGGDIADTAAALRPNPQITAGGALTSPGIGNQQEAEALFGQGTPIQLIRSRREFEAFVRRVILDQERVAVVLFFGRHCPYCMMFKGIFNETAKTVPASLGSDDIVFVAKEVALLEEDFIEDDEAAGGSNAGPGRRPAEPIEATLDVTFIPQIRILAPVSRRRHDQLPGSRMGHTNAVGTGNTADEHATQSGVRGEGGIEEIHASKWGAGNSDTLEMYWLPPARGRSIPWLDMSARATLTTTTGGGGGEQPAAYLAGRLPQADFSPEGIYKYLVDHIVVDHHRRFGNNENVMIASMLPLTATGSTNSSVLPPPVSAHGAFPPSPASHNQHFREVPSPNLAAIQSPVEKALLLLQSECKSSEAPMLQSSSWRRRHEALCSGSPRWDAEQERDTTLDMRLHDALSTLVYMLKRWVPMGKGKGDALTREAESVLQRLLEIARVTFPWQQVKKKLFKLQVILHLQGSGAEPIYPEWREPVEGLQEREKTTSRAGIITESSAGEEVVSKQWGWWHSNVETVSEKESAAKKHKQNAFADMQRGSATLNEGTEEREKEEIVSKTDGIPKTAWITAVKRLQLAGIGEGEEKKQHNPKLLQCETVLCGAWTLFHIMAESASAAFRDQISRAVEEASSKGGGTAAAGDNTHGGKKKETIDLLFYTPQDNLGTYAVRRYVELLHQEDSATTLASEKTSSGRGNDASTSRGRRKFLLAAENNLTYMIDVLEEELGSLDDPPLLQLFEEQLQRLHRRAVLPAAMIQQTLRDFIALFFSCYSCKDHFLQCYNRGFFGAREVVYPSAAVASATAAYSAKRQAVLAATAASHAGREKKIVFPAGMWKPVEQGRTGLTAAEVRKEKKNYLHLRLWLWRLHNAVNIRTSSEATLNAITRHPDLFLSKEEWQEEARLASSRRKRDYTVLQERNLGIGYYLNVDPRWPLRSSCPECRARAESSSSSSNSNNNSSSEVSENISTSRKGQDFLLTPQYLQKRENEKDICAYSDFFTDLDLREVKRFLEKTYWTMDRRPREATLGVDAVFDYKKGVFRLKH